MRPTVISIACFSTAAFGATALAAADGTIFGKVMYVITLAPVIVLANLCTRAKRPTAQVASPQPE